jgi:ribosomal protein S20
MPNKQNAKKALRQAKKRAIQNLAIKKTFKKAIKEVKSASAAELKEKLRLTQKALDKAAKKT